MILVITRSNTEILVLLKSSKSSTHYLNDTNRFDVSSKGPSSRISVKGLCSKRRICLCRLGSEYRTFAAF